MPQVDSNLEAAAQATLNWILDYWRQVESYPVMPDVKPGQILAALPASPPQQGENFSAILEDFKTTIVPGMTHWQHPKFFGYFPANSSPPAVLAEMLVATLGAQCMSWITSPAATELETRMMQWLREVLGLPSTFTGVIQDSASSATMLAMITARERATDFKIGDDGYDGRTLVAYASQEAHSSVEKAARIIGIGARNFRPIAVNTRQEIDTAALQRQLDEDIAAGKTPFFLTGVFGTTGTTAIDNLDALAAICAKYGLWFHVDAAYGGSALALEEYRPLAKGIERADSVVINPHKWLFTTFDCSAYFIKDPDLLTRAMAICPAYLQTRSDDDVINYRDWSLGLGRRFRALKLWFVLRSYGVDGLQAKLRTHMRLAQEFFAWIDQDENFEILAPLTLNLICFRYKPPAAASAAAYDQANLKLMAALNQSGKLFLTHTKIAGKVALRLAVGQTDVAEKHLREAWQDIRDASTRL